VVKQTPWLERTFHFPQVPGLYPNAVERVRGTAARIEHLVKDVTEEQITAKPDGKWSVKEEIGHLLALEELHIGRLHQYIQGVQELTAADMSNRKTEDADYNKMPLPMIIDGFRREREKMMEILDAADEDLVRRTAYHPRLKKQMTFLDIVLFVAEHDDHHLARIRRQLVG